MCQSHEMSFLEEMCTCRTGGDGSRQAASVLLALSCFNAALWPCCESSVALAVPLPPPRCHLCATPVLPFFFPQKLPGMVALKLHRTLGPVSANTWS